MRSLDIEEMFRELNRFAIGFDPTIRMLDQVRSYGNSGYPPYDLEQIGDTSYRLSMAVAGFSTDDLEITLHNGMLTIDGNVKKDDKSYLYKGIAGRNFRRSFYLNTWVEITGSNLANGILTIDFVQNIPETMKPRRISIGQTPPTLSILDAPETV